MGIRHAAAGLPAGALDPAGLLGTAVAFGAILVAMTLDGTPVSAVLLGPAMILVLLGSLGVGIANGLIRDAGGMAGQLRRAFLAHPTDPGELVGVVVRLSATARRDGLLALDRELAAVPYPFLRRGLQLAVDGTDADELEAMLQAEVDAKRRADRAAARIFTGIGGYAPTIGIVGTVIGLVHVLSSLERPQQLGHLIAGAFVATLWGIMSANVVWLPVAGRLRRLSDLECDQMELAIAGIRSILAGAGPRVVALRLHSFLPRAAAGRPRAGATAQAVRAARR